MEDACDLLSMENQNKMYLLLGCALFISVVYWSSPQRMYYTTTTITEIDKRPSFVVILTDDQDVMLGGMRPMRYTHKLLSGQGITLTNAFVASPLCCPSRSSILTGQYVHNHYAINNSLSGQCNGQRWRDGAEKKTFAAHLHNAGYQTFYAGKYLNQYGHPAAGGLEHVPPGWDWWVGLKGNSRYYNYSLSVNGSKHRHGSDPDRDYLTNVVRRHAVDFIRQVSSDPFLMVLAPPAPHAPFTSEAKYESNFTTLNAPRTPNFNVRNGADKHWLLRQGIQPLPDDITRKVDGVYRSRLRTLLSVDDMVRDVVSGLEAANRLDGTYVIFTSDNGYHLGQFSQPLDKREPYETDIRVPLVVRGPGIPHGLSSHPTTNIDLAPTLLDLAGVSVPKYMDGTSLKPVLTSYKSKQGRKYRKGRSLEPELKSGGLEQAYTVQEADKHPSLKPVLKPYKSNRGRGDTVQESDHQTSLDQVLSRVILEKETEEGETALELNLYELNQYNHIERMSLNPVSKPYKLVSDDAVDNSVNQAFYNSVLNPYQLTRDGEAENADNQVRRRTMLVEHAGEGRADNPGCEFIPSGMSGCNPDFGCKCEDSWNNTYACLRQMGPTEDRLYCRWADEEQFEEAYDLRTDPWQLNNTVQHLPQGVRKKLRNLLRYFQKCRGPRCSDLARFVM